MCPCLLRCHCVDSLQVLMLKEKCLNVPLHLELGNTLTYAHFRFSVKDDWNVRITKLRKQVEEIFNMKFGKLNVK